MIGLDRVGSGSTALVALGVGTPPKNGSASGIAVGGATANVSAAAATVSIDDTRTDQVVVCVLDAIRDTLARRPGAAAKVQLDGNEYVMRGEDNISTTATQVPTADETAEAGSDAAKELPLQAADFAAA